MPPRVSDLEDRVAVVTGAAHGIGLAIAKLLAEQRARVVAIDKDGPRLAAAFERSGCSTLEGDLTHDVDDLADAVVGDHGPPELIINNVGTQTHHDFFELSEPDFDLVFRTNLRGPWFLRSGWFPL